MSARHHTGRQRPHTRIARGRDEDGVALILVLMLIILLGAIVFEYAYETQVEASLAANNRLDHEAYIAAKSAVAAGAGTLVADLVDPNVDIDMAQGTVTADQYDSLVDVWAEGVPYQQINDAIMQCNISDEAGKINLNALIDYSNSDPDGQPPPAGSGPQTAPPNAETLRQALILLFAACEVDDPESLVDAIMDWVDEDDDPGPNGAESDFYMSLDPPYVCKNGPMDSIEELLLIPGMTPELYFDLNRDPAERETLAEDEVWLSLPDLLTVNGDPKGRINVNTAQILVLEAVLDAWGQGGGDLAQQIWERQLEVGGGYQEQQELDKLFQGPNPSGQQGGEPPPQTMFTIKSDVFRIHGNGRCDDVMVRIEAFVARADFDRIAGQPPINQNGDSMALLRFTDWRVIR